MTARHAQAAAIIECLRRRGIWVGLRKGETDIIPPPGNGWKAGADELIKSGKHLPREIREWLEHEERELKREQWERLEKLEKKIQELERQTIAFRTKGAP